MRANRRIDAAGTVETIAADHLFVKRLAHAMQALELVLALREVRPGQVVYGRQGLRVMRRELREHGVGRAEQLTRAGHIGDIGVDLASVDRKVGEAIDLRALDLGVPVGALDQPHHDPAIRAPGKIDDPIDHEWTALAVSLHHEAKPVPAGELRIKRQAFQQIQRQFEPIGFLGIDVEADVVALGSQREFPHFREEFRHDAVHLPAHIARMKRR
jgi:hypothetical protein